jgi:hypothetical protein
MNEDEQFFAWLDGELEGEAADRVAARVAASPELTAKAEQHRRLSAGLRGAFEPVVNAAGAAPSFQSADVIDFGAKAAARDQRRRWFAAPQWAAMAASLALGIMVGTQFNGSGDAPIAVDGARLVADASLDEALDVRLASAPDSDGVRIGLTFRDSSGNICRSFRDAAASGLACRDGDQWQVRGLFQGSAQQTDYRMAAGEDPRLAALIDETIAGEPFDATQEKAAQAKGWR